MSDCGSWLKEEAEGQPKIWLTTKSVRDIGTSTLGNVCESAVILYEVYKGA